MTRISDTTMERQLSARSLPWTVSSPTTGIEQKQICSSQARISVISWACSSIFFHEQLGQRKYSIIPPLGIFPLTFFSTTQLSTAFQVSPFQAATMPSEAIKMSTPPPPPNPATPTPQKSTPSSPSTSSTSSPRTVTSNRHSFTATASVSTTPK